MRILILSVLAICSIFISTTFSLNIKKKEFQHELNDVEHEFIKLEDFIEDTLENWFSSPEEHTSYLKNITQYPVIFVPGDGGNQIYAKLNKTSRPHYICDKVTKDFFELWLNLELISPYVIECLVDNIRLVYNRETKRTENSPGVETLIKDFGQTDSVEYLDSSKYSITTYFGLIAEGLVKNAGYKRGYNLKGAPYDWRKAPNELYEFYHNLTTLIEATYYENNGTPVMLIAHSMGNPVLLYWLNNYVNLTWKEKFIRNFVSLAGVWGGAAKPVRLMTSGDNLDIIVVKPLTARPYQRSASSTAWLMPSDKFWAADEILVSTPNRNYTVNDYEALFRDLNYEDGHFMRENTKDLIRELNPPDVEMHALYGVQMKTPAGFIWNKQKNFPDTQPSVVYGDGDGTVNLRSLHGYRHWIGKQKQPIYFKEFKGIDHLAILKSKDVIQYVMNLLKK